MSPLADVTEPHPARRAEGTGDLDDVHLPDVAASDVLSHVREQARILVAVWLFQFLYLLTMGAAFVLMLLSILGLI